MWQIIAILASVSTFVCVAVIAVLMLVIDRLNQASQPAPGNARAREAAPGGLS